MSIFVPMEKKEFSLDINSPNKFLRVVGAVFGFVCIALAISWLTINLKNRQLTKESVYPIVFIILFGLYQICYGLGKTRKYLKIEANTIQYKQHSIFPAKRILPDELDKIEIFPLSVHFKRKNSRKLVFRFGASYREIIEPIKNAIDDFAEVNGITLEYRMEEF